MALRNPASTFLSTTAALTVGLCIFGAPLGAALLWGTILSSTICALASLPPSPRVAAGPAPSSSTSFFFWPGLWSGGRSYTPGYGHTRSFRSAGGSTTSHSRSFRPASGGGSSWFGGGGSSTSHSRSFRPAHGGSSFFGGGSSGFSGGGRSFTHTRTFRPAGS